MKEFFSCDIIRDLLPGYIDGILSASGTDLVKEHLETCDACRQIYSDMKEEMNMDKDPRDEAVLDGFRKIKRYTQKWKAAAAILSIFSVVFLSAVFLKIFVIGELLPSYAVNIQDVSYEEAAGSLELSVSIDLPSYHVGRVTWERDTDDPTIIYVSVYAAKALPFSSEQTLRTVTIPNVQGNVVYLKNHGYQKLYDWQEDHYAQTAVMKQAIYQQFPSLDPNKDTLRYMRGIRSADGVKGICFAVESLPETVIWISLEPPYQISSYDPDTGETMEDPFTVP